ncbi:hypothetical protein [Phycicoccus duodecadis]|uniref:GIY-YIG domain-containing protein n=1 Tax=Phycicoccus duodecadis TaxID=173053 RepID=A0A2N3YFW5_9MICO|nr:hypothetical protein [Phycicoccus duodecadis]PKW25726.1 hypothetical protein ATL31_0525 [Phycicoccus duodecadis]
MTQEATPHQYCVYVIDVDGGSDNEVYVGQSWHPAEVRYEQHLSGERQAKVFRREGRSVGRLRSDLLPPLEPLLNRRVAEAAEKYVAALLESRAFVVHTG